MASIVPLKAYFSNGLPTVLSEMAEDSDVIPVKFGGTGFKSIEEFRSAMGLISATPSDDVTYTTNTHVIGSDDFTKRIYMNTVLDCSVQIPLDDGSVLPGTWFEVSRSGSGRTHIVGASGVTVNSKNNYNQINGLFGLVRLVYFGNNVWHMAGDLIAGSLYTDIIDLSTATMTGTPAYSVASISNSTAYTFGKYCYNEGLPTDYYSGFVVSNSSLIVRNTGYSTKALCTYLSNRLNRSASSSKRGIRIAGFLENVGTSYKTLGLILYGTSGTCLLLELHTSGAISYTTYSLTNPVMSSVLGTVIGWRDTLYGEQFSLGMEVDTDGTVVFFVDDKPLETTVNYTASSSFNIMMSSYNSKAVINDIRLF